MKGSQIREGWWHRRHRLDPRAKAKQRKKLMAEARHNRHERRRKELVARRARKAIE